MLRAARLEAAWRTWLWAQDGTLPQHVLESADLPGMPADQVLLEEVMQEWDLPEDSTEDGPTKSSESPVKSSSSQGPDCEHPLSADSEGKTDVARQSR